MEWLKRFVGLKSSETRRTSVRQVTVNNPLVVSSPRIGFFNLLGPAAQSIVEEDKRAFQPLFSSLDESSTAPPVCDVLMMYARIESDGRVCGSAEGLRDIIRRCGACIVVVASENEAEAYISAGKTTGYGQANLVMTLKRKGTTFTAFFAKLFDKMRRGVTMPVAWVQLAPQTPGARHNDCPESIFAAEISHIVFK